METNGCRSVVRFEDAELCLHEIEDQRWVMAREVAKALGYPNIRGFTKLCRDLRERKELRIGKQILFRSLPTDGGPQTCLILSYRGVIRSASRSDAPRAIAFRDWAEDVLFEAMVTGRQSERPERRHWTEELTPGERLELVKMRVQIGMKMMESGIGGAGTLFVMLDETYGGKGELAKYMAMKGLNKEKAEEEARAWLRIA